MQCLHFSLQVGKRLRVHVYPVHLDHQVRVGVRPLGQHLPERLEDALGVFPRRIGAQVIKEQEHIIGFWQAEVAAAKEIVEVDLRGQWHMHHRLFARRLKAVHDKLRSGPDFVETVELFGPSVWVARQLPQRINDVVTRPGARLVDMLQGMFHFVAVDVEDVDRGGLLGQCLAKFSAVGLSGGDDFIDIVDNGRCIHRSQ